MMQRATPINLIGHNKALETPHAWYFYKLVQAMLAAQTGRPKIPRDTCPDELRERVRAAFRCCEYCGLEWTSTRRPCVDRIVSPLLGAGYHPSNVAAACHSCNSRKGNREFIGPVRSLTMMEARK